MTERRVLIFLGGAALATALMAQTESAKPAGGKPPTGLQIESVFGRGFGRVFKQEVILQQTTRRKDSDAKSAVPFWMAHAPGSEKTEPVSGRSRDDQQKIQKWAQDHPDKAIKVIAYETIQAGGCPGSSDELGANEFFPLSWPDRSWEAQPKLIVLGFEE